MQPNHSHAEKTTKASENRVKFGHADRRRGHPLKSMERDFQAMIADWGENGTGRTPEVQAALIRVRRTLFALGCAILLSNGVKNAADVAEELTHDWFERMWRTGLKNYEPCRPFYVYAYRAFTNLCASYHRRQRYRATQSFGQEPVDERRSGARSTAISAARLDVQAAMTSLPAPLQTAVTLVHMEGLTHTEAAQTLGVDEATVGQRTFRGRQQMRRWLSSRSK